MATHSFCENQELVNRSSVTNVAFRLERVLQSLSSHLVRTADNVYDDSDLQLRILGIEVLLTGKALIGLLKIKEVNEKKDDMNRLASQRVSKSNEPALELCHIPSNTESRFSARNEYPFHG